ncbi:MAG: hypothetical protein COW78_19625, partial [Bdellovibrio sp. CG22_combo_CG10-13_8_21_14_all_39_27]
MKNFLSFFMAFVAMISTVFANNGNLDYRNVGTLSPSDYLLGSHGRAKDPVFDEYRTIDLNLDIGLGAD